MNLKTEIIKSHLHSVRQDLETITTRIDWMRESLEFAEKQGHNVEEISSHIDLLEQTLDWCFEDLDKQGP